MERIGARTCWVAVAALAGWATPVGASGPTVRLDSRFGTGGVIRRVVPIDSTFASDVAVDGRGRLLALSFGGGTLTRFTASGRLDRSFGHRGAAAVEGLGFGGGRYVDDLDTPLDQRLMVDPTGAVTATFGLIDVHASVATGQGVFRVGANGAADPTFNGGAARVLRLGRPVAGVVVDADGRTTVAGSDARGITLARLRDNGHLDRSYARDGTWHIAAPGLRSPHLLADGSGTMIVDVAGGAASGLRIIRARRGGRSAQRFDSLALADGARVTRAVPASRGSVAVLGSDERGLWVVHLRRDGALDVAFGVGGLARLPTGWGASDLRALAGGRLVVAVQRPGGPGLLALGPTGTGLQAFGPAGSFAFRRPELQDRPSYIVLGGLLAIDPRRRRLTAFAVGTHPSPGAGGEEIQHGAPEDEPPDDLLLARVLL